MAVDMAVDMAPISRGASNLSPRTQGMQVRAASVEAAKMFGTASVRNIAF